MSTLSISLLGGFNVLRDGEPITAFGYDKVRALLAFLAVEAERPHRRDRLAALLWPEQPRSPALQSLSQALYQLRRVLGDQAVRACGVVPLLLVTPQTVQFNLAADFSLDVRTLQKEVAACTMHAHTQLHACPECMVRLHAAVALYRGPFLEGFSLPGSADFDEWSLVQREHLEHLVVETLRTLWIAHNLRREHAQALAFARQRLAVDPWQEEAHREAMQSLAAGGDRAAALAQFEACRRVLAAELGIEPCAETLALYRQLSGGGDAFASGAEPRRLLPVSLTSLVGRVIELAAIRQQLENPACRLLSLVGPGGSGKTHLALAAAAELGDGFVDGMAWVALGGVPATPPFVPVLLAAIAKALDFTFAPHEDPRRQLQNYLHAKQMLLLLDNFEHLLGGAHLLPDLLAAAPDLKILVTSRTRLNVQGEHVLALGGLTLPSPTAALGAGANGGVDTAALAHNESVALFLLHACRVQAGFAPSANDLAAIAQICTAVDGMPLPILLAAAWMDTLAPPAIAERIMSPATGRLAAEAEPAVDFLAAEWSDLPTRQHSMRTVLEQSWLLLTPEEQQVIACLAVLRGSMTYAAAQAVAHATLHQLRALVEKSWLRRSAEHRYELHELLRQFAAEKLQSEPGAHDAACTAHCAHFAAVVQHLSGALGGEQQLAALAELELELDNARSAWAWALRHADLAALDQMLEGLCRFFDWRGPYQQGEELCRQTVADLRNPMHQRPPAGQVPLLPQFLGRLLAWQGRFSRLIGDAAAASAALEEALVLTAGAACAADGSEDTLALRAFVLHEQGRLQMSTDRIRAKDLCLECLALYRAAQNRSEAIQVLNTLGDLHFACGDYARGLAVLDEAVAHGRALGDRRLIAESLHRAGVIRAAQGDIGAAGRLQEESTSICRAIGDGWGVADGELELASVLMYGGRFDEAAAYYAQSAGHYSALGSRSGYAGAVHLLAWAYTNLGDYAAAGKYYRHAQEIWAAERDSPGLGMSALGLGGLALVLEDYAGAQVLLADASVRFAAVQQAAEQAIALGMLAAALHGLNRPEAARNCVREALSLARATGAFPPVHFALESYALMIAAGGDPARGLELYTAAARHPYVANSCWHAGCFGRRIDALAAGLSPAAAPAARARALACNTESVVDEVLAELAEAPAAAETIDRRRADLPAVGSSCHTAQAADGSVTTAPI